MAKSANQKKATATYEMDWSDENQDRCPGYRVLEYEGLCDCGTCETLIRCDLDRTRRGHIHQYLLRCDPSNPEKEKRTQRVPIYGWIVNLLTESEAISAHEQRRERAGRKQEARQRGAVKLRSQLTKLSDNVPPEVLEWLDTVPPMESEAETLPESNDPTLPDSLVPPDLDDDRDDDIPEV